MGGALTELQSDLLRAYASEDWARFIALSDLCDRFSQTTFIAPMEGYIRRMMWAAAAEGALPAESCDDPWGPALPVHEREAVERLVRDARATRA